MHDKVYLVNGFAVKAAIGTKTKYGVGLGVHLHARGAVVVERAVYALVPVRF
jgi:sRNA-binding regulator protein Hfq